jgi:adenylate kinase
MVIILLGPPGAGKGTQAKTLAQKMKLPHISTGDILRQNAKDATELGRRAKEFMHKGALVPDALVNQMLVQRLGEDDTRNGFILDGYPRNINQAEALDGILQKKNIKVDFVIYLDTSERVIIQRLGGRLVCSSCGEIFHIKNMPPKVDMICDTCGGKLYQRTDDQEETIKKRLEVYRLESSPVINYYKAKKKLYTLLADGEASIVLNEIIQLVHSGSHDSLKV